MRRDAFPLGLIVVTALVVSPVWAGPSKKPQYATHTPSDQGYTAIFPSEVDTSTKELATTAGNMSVRAARSDFGGVVYSVTVTEFPDSFRDATAAKLLDATRDGMKGVDGNLAKESASNLDGVQGKEVRIEVGRSNAIRARMFFVNHRLYQVMVVGPKDKLDGGEPDQFLKSFGWAR
jgi:hypothetical protein